MRQQLSPMRSSRRQSKSILKYTTTMGTNNTNYGLPARTLSPKAVKPTSCSVALAVSILLILFFASPIGCNIAPTSNSTTAKKSLPNNYYRWNCGVNVAYISLRLFGKQTDIHDLADQLKAGPRFQGNVSFLSLKKAFQDYGLFAEGFKADSPEEILSFAKPDNILILYVHRDFANQTVGHFIIIKTLNGYLLTLDPPHHPKKFTRSDMIHDGVLSAASGEFLIIYEP